jgi:hypothetical protein
MATNHYFNNYSGVKINEIKLYEDLIVQAIKIMGADIYYMPRDDWDDTDMIFGENIQSRFDRAYMMEMYIQTNKGWEGQGDFFSRFGLEIRDNSNFIVARRTFEKYVQVAEIPRPREGDLIFAPVFNKIFEIKFVEQHNKFYTRGYRQPYVYELRCEAYRYSHENIDTGNRIIDIIDDNTRYTIQIVTTAGSGNYNIGETVYQGASVAAATASARVSNWMPANNTLQLTTIKGDFASGNVIGANSGTTRAIANTDIDGDHTYYDHRDNKLLSDEANTILDRSETNPFGNP